MAFGGVEVVKWTQGGSLLTGDTLTEAPDVPPQRLFRDVLGYVVGGSSSTIVTEDPAASVPCEP